MANSNKKRILAMTTVASILLLVFGYVFFQDQPRQTAERAGHVVQMSDTTLDAETRTLIAEKRKQGLEPNRLIYEKSPYLLQHAFNPVDWYPWGEAAFEEARQEDKLIFLSVGYSTCYWCHVMERTVFEQDSLAALLNASYVSIKVDREERPDVDRVYMAALQGMAGGGGWPMSMFLTPDLKPFFGATYIPPKAQYGRPGFGEVARSIHRAWTSRRQEVLAQADQVTQYLQRVSLPQVEPTPVGETALTTALSWYEANYDTTYGGFGDAPKFPRPVSLDFLLAYYERTGDEKALRMALTTLRQMAHGGMYDHVGEGFHRYATDARWRVPHFEKMLYDQALLASAYLRAFATTGDSLYASVARDVLTYVERVMLHSEGGFYSAEDAESTLDPAHPEEKEEGAFYVWTKTEIDGLLGRQAAQVFAYVYGVEEGGNAEEDPHREFVGENILYQAHTLEEAAEHFGLTRLQIASLLEQARLTLFAEREKRPKPHLDDKIILSWNGLMISAYADAYRVLGDAQYREVAERTVVFLFDTLYDPKTGRFKRRYRAGEARYDAHLEDYAFFAHGLIDLYQATRDEQALARATAVARTMIERFYDPQQGGFFATAGEDASILVSSKEYYDGAEPSGNSMAILDLVRLYETTGDDALRQKADQSLAYFGTILQRGPASPVMLRALAQTLDGSRPNR